MKNVIFFIVMMMVISLGLPGLHAAEPKNDSASDPLTIHVYVENDSQALKPNNPSDRWYTNGAAISIDHRPKWAADLAEHLPFADQFGPARVAMGYTAGHQIFTPRDIHRSDFISNDQPYAGYMYAGVFLERATDQTQDHFQFDLGLVGESSLGREVQNNTHRLFGADEAQGWDHQLRDEPTFQFYIRKKWRLDVAEFDLFDQHLDMQLLPQVGVALGTVYRHLEGGLTMRFGINLPDDFGPSRLADIGAAMSDPKPGLGLYGFARLGGRVVEHNIFIEGNTFRDSHGVNEKPLVGEAQYGVVLNYRGEQFSMEIGYSQTHMTKEFDRQSGTPSFGAWAANLTCWF